MTRTLLTPHMPKVAPTAPHAWAKFWTGSAIGDFAKSVWKAFPDVSLEIISIGDTGGGLVAIQWILHGTHTGPLMDGTPPTGRKVSYPGASFVQVEGDKIRSEQTYVDRQTVAELLGLKAK